MSTPTTPTINGYPALWGMDGSVYTGMITAFDGNDMADDGELLDNNGYKITDITFNQNSEYQLTITMESGTVKPAIGTLLTIDGVANCIVKTTGRTYGQKDWRKLKLTAKNWVNLVPSS
jgi:hypothetical protein